MLARIFAPLWNNPWILLALCLTFWASNVVAARLAVGEASPMLLGCMRWLVASAIMLPFVWRQIGSHGRMISDHWLYLLLISCAGFAFYSCLFYAAGNFTSGVNISTLVAIVPVFTIVFAWLFLRIPVGPVVIFGVILTVLGAVTVATRGDLSVLRGFDFNIGDIMMICASLFHAAFTVALRNRPPFPPMLFFTLLAMIALVVSLPPLVAEIALGKFFTPSWLGIAILIYVGTFPTIISQSFYMRSIELIGPHRTTLFYNTVPLLGAAMSVVFLGETFETFHAIAFALVLAGIALAEYWRARHP